MLKALVDFAERSRGELVPLGYRRMEPIRWALEVAANGTSRLVKTEIDKPRPSRNRSVGIDPLLLADTATYVLGISEKSAKAQRRAEEARTAFWELLAQVERETDIPTLKGLSKALAKFPPAGMEEVAPKDVVIVRRKGDATPFDEPAVQAFWKAYLEDQMTAETVGQCASCAGERRLLRILPTGVKGFPQDVKLTSFNLESFESYGIEQNLNAPLCFDCGTMASAGLSHLLESRRHRLTIVRGDGMAQQTAVFWLKDDHVVDAAGQAVDVGAAIHLLATGRLPEEVFGKRDETRPALEHAAGLLRTPWKPREAALATDPDAFHLAVVSANISRLVLRDWAHGSLVELRDRMGAFLEATRMVDGWGQEVRSQSLMGILEATGAFKVNPERRIWDHAPPQADLVRAMVRSAFFGYPAPRALTTRAVRVLRIPAAWSVDRLAQANLAAIRLERCSREGNALTPKDRLDSQSPDPAYLCGRLFAVLERAQGAASKWSLNTTIVERSYGSASTSPRNTLPPLIRLATTAHLPKAPYLNQLMEDLMTRIHAAGGFPKTLTLAGQADFALGFYQQRAELRAEAKARGESKATQEATP